MGKGQLSGENLEKREKVWAWLGLPQRQRGMRASELKAELQLGPGQYTRWKREYEAKVASERTEREVTARAKMEREIYQDPRFEEQVKGNKHKKNTGRWTVEDLDEEDPEGWWKRRTLELNSAILKSAKAGNAQSQKLAKQLAGELVEKSEVQVDLSAEDYFRIREEGRRRAEATNRELNGDRGLLTESSPLPETIRTD